MKQLNWDQENYLWTAKIFDADDNFWCLYYYKIIGLNNVFICEICQHKLTISLPDEYEFNSLDEAKQACQIHFENWISKLVNPKKAKFELVMDYTEKVNFHSCICENCSQYFRYTDKPYKYCPNCGVKLESEV